MRPDLWAEFNAARRAMSPESRAFLAERGIAPGEVDLLCGAARVRLDTRRALYEPDADGAAAFITPVLIEWPDTPEAADPARAVRFGDLVDLVAWHPAHPDVSALRVGAAEWLGAIEPQYLDPEPVLIHSGVVSWLRSRANGLVLLSQEPASRYRVLSACSRITAQSQTHARELRRALRWPGHAPVVSIA